MYRLASILPLLLGIASLAYAASTLSLGKLTAPGPGLWPFLISVGIATCAVVLLIVDRPGVEYERFSERVRLVGLAVTALAVFIVLFSFIGLVIPGSLLLIMWLRVISGESWRTAILVAVGCTLGFYILFGYLLGVPLPDNAFLPVL